MSFQVIPFRATSKEHAVQASIRKVGKGTRISISVALDVLEEAGLDVSGKIVPMIGTGADSGLLRFRLAQSDETGVRIKPVMSSSKRGAKLSRGLVTLKPWLDVRRIGPLSCAPCKITREKAGVLEFWLPAVLRQSPSAQAAE